MDCQIACSFTKVELNRTSCRYMMVYILSQMVPTCHVLGKSEFAAVYKEIVSQDRDAVKYFP